MALKVADRIQETSTTTSTGTYSLDGAVTGFQAFSVLGAGATTGYFATDDTNWEVGIGTVGTGPATLARTTILASSNGGSAVNWGTGTRRIYCSLPAAFSPRRELAARSSNTILAAGDCGLRVAATSTFTQTLDAAATLGDGWWVHYRNEGTGVITLDPNSSEQIDGLTTITLTPGESCLIVCNGSAFKTFGRNRSVVLAKSGAAVSCPADTSEDVLATITVPANKLGANGVLRIRALFTITNSANNKTCRIRLGGIGGTVMATSTAITTWDTVMFDVLIVNQNAANSQRSSGLVQVGAAASNGLVSAATNATAAIDTTSSTTVVITGQKASSGETITLQHYLCELITDDA